jgi:hypothetical protein
VSGHTGDVIFDKRGPGVITRINLVAEDKRGRVRFYFDGSETPGMELPAYDFSSLDIPGAGTGLLNGNTLYFPVPFHTSCRITFEKEPGVEDKDKYYQIDYRLYPEETSVETFSLQSLPHIKKTIAGVEQQLQTPDSVHKAEIMQGEFFLGKGDPGVVKLPRGEHAVYVLSIQVTPSTGDYEQAMRDVVMQGTFDGKQTVWAPISDFSGGGMGGPAVKSWYLRADGRGRVVSRWLMPYKEVASLAFINEGRDRLKVAYSITVAPLAWDERMLYFHASWNEETGLHLYKQNDSTNGKVWNVAAISGGRGVYKGEALTVFNHTTGWFAAGNTNVWVDNDTRPAHEAAATAAYYNVTQPSATPFQTPFGGLMRADLKSSYGYNSLLRLRHLDAIPFSGKLRMDMDLTGRKAGRADYATTYFWYGDIKARPEKTTRSEVMSRLLLPAPATDTTEPD